MARALGTYRYDPATGQAYLLTDPTGIYPVDPNVLVPHDLAIDGYQVRNTATGRIVDQLGLAGPIQITPYDNGRTLIVSGISQRTLTASGPRGATYTLNGDITVVLPDGSTQDVFIPRAIVSKPNDIVYRYVDAEGVERFDGFRPGSEQDMENQRVYGESYRVATPLEATDYAIKGYLLKNERPLVLDAAARLAEQVGGTVNSNFSDALDMLYQQGTGNLSFGKETYVAEGGNPFVLGQP